VLPVCVTPDVPLLPLVPVILLVAPAAFAFAGALGLVVVVPQAQQSEAVNKIERATVGRILNPPE